MSLQKGTIRERRINLSVSQSNRGAARSRLHGFLDAHSAANRSMSASKSSRRPYSMITLPRPL